MNQPTLFTFEETPAGFTPSPVAAPRPAKTREAKPFAPLKRVTSEASKSPCKRYCYIAFRRWDTPISDRVMFIGLHPTLVVDEERDDATLRHEVHYAHDWGFGGVVKAYLYGWRTNGAAGLQTPGNPVDHLRGYYDRLIATHASRCELIVAAWGDGGGVCQGIDERAQGVLQLLNRPVHCLGTSASGSPLCPSRLSKDRKPQLFWTPEGGFYREGTKDTKTHQGGRNA